jgi:HEAT repeat protein
MAGRESLEDKLASIRALRGRASTPERSAALRKRLGDRSNLVVAAAAGVVGEDRLDALAGDLEAAFDRFLVDPAKVDKLCRAKLAVVEALDRMEHLRTEVFRKAARHVQPEPAWGGPQDTAPPLRAAALVALARAEGSAALPWLVDALADPAREVRMATASALGAVGGEAAALVLRLKARLGDDDPDVLSECLGGLLAADPEAGLPLVAGFLDPADAAACEAAAMALGKSRLPEALEPLRTCWGRAHSAELRGHLLLAVAILRRPAAIDFLVDLVARPPEPGDDLAALAALRIYKEDPRVRERLASVVGDRDGAALRARFAREFG